MSKSHNLKIEAILWRWMRLARLNRIPFLAFWITLAGLGLWLSLSFLGVNTNTSEMIDPDVPYRVAQTKFEQAFPDTNDQILVIIRADSPDGLDVFSAELAATLKTSELVRSVSHPPSDLFFQKNGLLYLEIDALESQLAQLTEAAPLIERLTLSPTTDTLFEILAQLAEQESKTENADRLLLAVAKTLNANLAGQQEPLSWQESFSQDQSELYQTVITLDPVLDWSRLRPAAPIQELIGTLSQQISQTTQIKADVAVTGDPALRSDELQSVSQGIGLAFLISFIVVGFILIYALRSFTLAACVLIVLIISILITAGFAALIYGQLNLVSVAFTVLMVGLGVDFAIHLLMHLQGQRREGFSIPATFYRSSRKMGTALVLTAPSTALAFLSFVPTKFVGIAQLGVVASIGVVIAFLVATSFLPAIFSYLPAAHASVRNERSYSDRNENIQISPPKHHYLAFLVICLGIAALAVIPKARFEADPMALRAKTAPSVTAFNLLFDKSETRPYRLSILADSPEAAQKIGEDITQFETVESTQSLLSFIPEDQYDKLDLIDYAAIGLEFALSGEGVAPESGADPAADLEQALKEYDTPAARELEPILRQWRERTVSEPELQVLTGRDLFFYWPHQRDRLRKQITASEVGLADLPQSLIQRYRAENGQSRLDIIPAEDVRNIKARGDFVKEVVQFAPGATGSARTVHDAGDIIRKSMLQAVITALISVSALLYFVVRNGRLVIIMLVPLILAAILTTATGVILNLPYNFANVIVLPLLIGIGVDSSLHLALQHNAGSRQNKVVSMIDKITPRAVVFSAVTTIASFGSLSFSAHRGTASMGLLLMIAIIWVLICTLSVTPALIKWTSQKRDVK